MAVIPNMIRGVKVQFAPGVLNNVDEAMIEGLRWAISLSVGQPYFLEKLWISSLSEPIPQHKYPSRHAQRKAVDISRINGVKIIVGYPKDPMVKAIVDGLQSQFETFPLRRENFGPLWKKKLGASWPVGGHKDHIHFSVN